MVSFKESIMKTARDHKDLLGSTVLKRIAHVVDLVAADEAYHRKCHKKFLHKPSKYVTTGRPESRDVITAVNEICSFLEENSDECQFRLSELMDRITGCVNYLSIYL